jgi:hypothetical protein
MYLETYRSLISANHKKIGYTNRKSAKCSICRSSANVTNFLSPHICQLSRIHDILLWIRIRILILDPDPAIFVIDLQDAKKKKF